MLKDNIIDAWYTQNGEETAVEINIDQTVVENGKTAVIAFMDDWVIEKEQVAQNVGYTNPF
jgi:hypothetical protein